MVCFLHSALSGRIAFKLSSIKAMFYVPIQQFMGLINTQISGFMSDKFHHSAAKRIRIGFLVCAIAMISFWWCLQRLFLIHGIKKQQTNA